MSLISLPVVPARNRWRFRRARELDAARSGPPVATLLSAVAVVALAAAVAVASAATDRW